MQLIRHRPPRRRPCAASAFVLLAAALQGLSGCHDPIERVGAIWPIGSIVVQDCSGDGTDDVLAYHLTGESGAPMRSLDALSGTDGSLLWRVENVDPGEYCYAPQATDVGDSNGDGKSDFAVSVMGQVSVLSGADGASLFAIDDAWGRSHSGRVDVDGDGHPDVIVGERLYGEGASQFGRVCLVSGATGIVLWSSLGSAGERIGLAVAGVRVQGAVLVVTLARRDSGGLELIIFDAAGRRFRTISLDVGVKGAHLLSLESDEVGVPDELVVLADDGRIYDLDSSLVLNLAGVAAAIGNVCGAAQWADETGGVGRQLAVIGTERCHVLDLSTGRRIEAFNGGVGGVVRDRDRDVTIGNLIFDGNGVRLVSSSGVIWQKY